MSYTFLDNKCVLVTGGTGSFGKAFVKFIFENNINIRRLVIFSRDEQKHFNMLNDYTPEQLKRLRFFIGDVRDKSRIRSALEGVDYVVHAAAMKHVHIAEYNPIECIKTNILGAENLIEACFEKGIQRVVALSTDKAAAPINLYGATKLVSDKLFVAANNIKGLRNVKLSVVRYGNVMGSNGSVIPFFIQKKHTGTLPITDERMTRFNISLIDGVKMVIYALEHAMGGEIFVPKIPSYKILDVANAIAPDTAKAIVGIRPGEKIHEEMITSSDSFTTYDIGKYYAILPQKTTFNLNDFISYHNATKVEEGFCYNSATNTEWINVDDIKALIKEHVNSDVTNCTDETPNPL